jgi:ribonuclease Z
VGSARPILNLCVTIALALTGGLAAPSAGTQQIPVRATDAASGTNPVNEFRVLLLGTVSPTILVEAGSERLVFDCGRSCTTRLWQLHIPLGTVKLFLTHLHSDHTVGIPDLWRTGFSGNPLWRADRTVQGLET